MKARINNDIIKNVFDGDGSCIPMESGDTTITVPEGFTGQYGQNIKMYDSSYNLRTAEDLVKDGYIVLQPEEKIVDHKVVKKTLQELYDEGIYIPPTGSKVINNTEYTLEEYRSQKYADIEMAFQNMYAIGMSSPTLGGGLVDCRRPQFDPYEDDIGNITTLLNVMKTNGISSTGYRMKDNSTYPNVTQEMMQLVIDEMGLYGVTQYQKRADIKDAIKDATTFNQIQAIGW